MDFENYNSFFFKGKIIIYLIKKVINWTIISDEPPGEPNRTVILDTFKETDLQFG